MPALLLKLLPFRDWLWAGAVAALVVFYNVHVDRLENAAVAHERAAVAAESAKVEASAQARLAAQAKDYADREAATEDNYEHQLQADSTVHAADLQRLRRLAAQGSGSTTLGGSTGSGSPPGTGGSSLVGLGYVSEELASALRDARDDLGACYAERDALTGK